MKTVSRARRMASMTRLAATRPRPEAQIPSSHCSGLIRVDFPGTQAAPSGSPR